MVKVPLTNKPSAPIPGENYTSDTKNYPWHRPPDHTNIDDMIIATMKQLTTKEATYGLLNTLQTGITIVQAATMFIVSGVGSGKWAVDHGILLAGPVAKIMQIMADGAKIKYQMGLEGDPIMTSSYYKAVTNVDDQTVTFAQEAARSHAKDIKPPAGAPDTSAVPTNQSENSSITGDSAPVPAPTANFKPSSNTLPSIKGKSLPPTIGKGIMSKPSVPGGSVPGRGINPNTATKRLLPRMLPMPLSQLADTTQGGSL